MCPFLRIFLLGLLVIVPLLSPFKHLGYEQIKVEVFVAVIAMLSMIWLLNISLLPNEGSWTFNSRHRWYSLLVGWLLFTSLVGADPQISLFGRQPYLQGWLVYFSGLLLMILIDWSKLSMRQLSWCLTLSAGMVGVMALTQWLQITYWHQIIPTYAGRVVSSFGQPNMFAGFLGLVLPLIYWLLGHEKSAVNRCLLLGLGGLGIAGMLISQSRAGLLLLLWYGLVWLLVKQPRIRLTLIAGLLGAGLIYSMISLQTSTGWLWQELVQPTTNQWLIDNSPEKRIHIWNHSLWSGLERPLTGFGLENIPIAWQSYQPDNPGPEWYGVRNLMVDRAHSYWLDLFLFSGIIGLLLYLKMLRVAWQESDGITRLWLVSFLVWSSIQVSSIVHLILLWVMLSISYRNNHSIDNRFESMT